MRRVWTVLQVLGASLVVGLLMTALELTPAEVYEGVADGLALIGRWVVDLVGGRWGTAVVAGASVVVPIWVVVYLVRRKLRR